MEYPCENLYLAKDTTDSKQDIYVQNCPLVQHQLDGIRFLYRAYIKKIRGVILNDPPGYGKRVQTALFLSAILPRLAKPVLILCTEAKQQLWISHFEKWTQISDDITIELSNAFVKKKILLSAPNCAGAFARRDWSLLVLDDCISKDVVKAALRADLKLWITSSNVKEDLSLYSSFHSWVYPKEKFIADKYRTNKSNLKDVLVKMATLDAFLQDTVLRRSSEGDAPFLSAQVSINNSEITITKKNKDATGSKIKRSKRKSTDNNILNAKVAKAINTSANHTDIYELHNEKPTKLAKTNNENSEDFNIGDINTSSDEEIAPSRRNRVKNVNINWDSDSDSDCRQKDKTVIKQTEALKNTNIFDESELQSGVLRLDSDTDSDSHKDLIVNKEKANVPSNLQSVTKVYNEIFIDNADIGNNADNIFAADDKIDDAKDDLENNSRRLKDDEKQIETSNINDMDNEINKIYPINELVGNYNLSEDLFSTDTTPNHNGIVKTRDTTNDKKDSTKDKLDELKVNEIVQESNHTDVKEDLDRKTDQVKPEDANLSSFELKLKQLEELTLKKFKGSFLDSIF